MFLSSCLLHAQKYLSSIISYLHLFSRHKHYLKVQDLKLMSHSSFFPSSGYKLSSHSIKYSLFAQVAFKEYRNKNVSFLHCQQILIIIFIKLKLLKFLLLCLSVIISSHPFFFFFFCSLQVQQSRQRVPGQHREVLLYHQRGQRGPVSAVSASSL